MVKPGLAIYRYELPPGTRAIGISLDTNLYNGLNNHFFGKPRERDVFSNNTRGFMGQPSFEDTAFSVGGRGELFVKL